MNDKTFIDRSTLPSTARLLKATGIAVVVAGILLATAVLPAEYGIDPTGLGARLGLASLSTSSTTPIATQTPAPEAEASPPAVSAPQAVWKSATPYRSDELTLALRPNEGAEIKAKMRAGDRFIFSWAAEGGTVNFDMHGEAPDAKGDEFTSYWKGKNEGKGHGAFEAPFDGTHGWFWRNRGKEPVTVRVKTSGFYDKLYRP